MDTSAFGYLFVRHRQSPGAAPGGEETKHCAAPVDLEGEVCSGSLAVVRVSGVLRRGAFSLAAADGCGALPAQPGRAPR